MCASVHWVMTPEGANSKSENWTYLGGCGLVMKESLMGALSLSGVWMVCSIQKPLFCVSRVCSRSRKAASFCYACFPYLISHIWTHADQNWICLGGFKSSSFTWYTCTAGIIAFISVSWRNKPQGCFCRNKVVVFSWLKLICILNKSKELVNHWDAKENDRGFDDCIAIV